MIEVPDNDIEYYQRKVVRMEQDICILQEELNRVRLKLRTAEDYEIKYRILIKNNEVDLQRTKIETAKIEEGKNRERIAEALKQNDEHWSKVKEDLETQLRKEANEKLEKVLNDLQIANKKLKEISQKKEEMDLFSFKIRKFEKENSALEIQLADIKRACEREKNDQLTSLRNQLNAGFRERLAAERQSSQARIQSLTKKLVENEAQESVQLKLPDISNAELVALRDLYAATKASHQKEIDQSHEVILRKNVEIKSLLREQSEREVKLQELLSNKNKEISHLEEEITRVRRQHQQEILDLGKQLGAVKESQGEILKEQIRTLSDRCKQMEVEMGKQAQEHSQQIQSQSQRAKEDFLRIIEEKGRCQKLIAELSDRAKQRQEKIVQLTSQLNLEKSKQLHANGEEAGEYENGILFLERQLRRSEHKNQENGRLYAKLQADFQAYRKETQQEIGQLHEQLKAERKEGDEKLRTAQGQVREMVDRITAKNKELVHNKKQFINEKLSLEVQVRTLARELEQLEADYNRLQETRKQLEASLKNERLKGSDVYARELEEINVLQGDLEGIYREKEENLVRKHDEIRKKMSDEIRNLQQKLKQLDLENITLKKAHQRLSNELQGNKQNARTDQQRKVATVELELARLNNIYQAFVNNQSNEHYQPKNLLGLSRREQSEFLTPKVFK